MKALPSEEELTQAGLPHAGEYLTVLSENPEAEQQFLRNRSRESDEPSDLPIQWKVRQFILWMVYCARGNAGDPEAELTEKEADKFKRGAVAKTARPARDGENAASAGPGAGDEVEIIRNNSTAPPAAAPLL